MGRIAEILLVEDDEDDYYLTKEGFQRAKFAVNLHRVENGIECMKFLRKQESYADVPTPDIILLDLNMPLMDGREVLRQIIADNQLRRLPVVVLTTSDRDADILEMYENRCSSYIVKPVDFNKFRTAIEEFSDYWFTLVSIPTPLLKNN